MPTRALPNLSPDRVIELMDALLANAARLLRASVAVYETGDFALAHSLAVLAIEESGKAIAVHERRIAMVRLPQGEPFRCNDLDELWANHDRKLQKVYDFLVREDYWFDTEPSDPDANARLLGSMRAWSRRQNRAKLHGLYVDIGKTGDLLEPATDKDDGDFADVIARVHQIGWQIRLGEHIEGKAQDQREAGVAPSRKSSLAFHRAANRESVDEQVRETLREIAAWALEGTPGEELNNAEYRFNPPGADRSPFRNVGNRGYEAETLELAALANALRTPDTSASQHDTDEPSWD